MTATRESLIRDLRGLGVEPGSTLMLHVSLRAVGPIAGGATTLLDALDAAVGETGGLLMVLGAKDVPEWAGEAPSAEAAAAALAGGKAFDAPTTPAAVDVGWFAEVFRSAPDTRVSNHPLGRFGARGSVAAFLVEGAPWDHYYGPDSPLDRFAGLPHSAVLRLGANVDTVTLLHHAEYLVPLEGKRSLRRYVAIDGPDGPETRRVDALDDDHGIVEWEGEDYFGLILRDYLATGRAREGVVGGARSELLDAKDLLAFGVRWMQEQFGRETRVG